eukprot:TRINITY_DN35481_c0_g1_i1.p1 TRINITY_DN35481_c0_g1~~TRINITY_DN35481_c0_g1_i1.p1  ORF type:complete len:159 (+),score=44.73 TRINITY_DN35481_c0_g1_i1:74-550(+)
MAASSRKSGGLALLPSALAILAIAFVTLQCYATTAFLGAAVGKPAQQPRGAAVSVALRRALKIGETEITEIKESDEQPKVIFGSIFGFIVGLKFPLFGGFTLGVFLAAASYFIGSLKPKTVGAEDDLGDYADIVRKVGEYGVRFYNFVYSLVDKNVNK